MKTNDRMADTRQCPACGTWLECRHGRRELDEHLREAHALNRTVLRAQLFGPPIDTHQTETELNGFRATQGRMI